jgi:hypothetical protein
MSKLPGSPPFSQRRPAPSRAVAPFLVAVLALLSLALCASSLAARAQSGRRGQPKPAATPTPSPEATPKDGQGESESIPRGRAAKPADVVASFIVMEYDSGFNGVDFRAREDIMDSFMHRLGEARAVAASFQGHGNRKEAHDRAKAERDSYVVLFELEEDSMAANPPSIGQSDTRRLTIKTYVYAPKTGDLKFTDTVYQRPYRETARIGGIPVPVPSRRIEQYPSQLQLEQAARDAADRLMQRFGITLPNN